MTTPTRPSAAMPAATLALLVLLLAWSSLAHAVLPIENWTTSRGARVYFVRAAEIPMLDVNVDFDAGSRFDPPGKEGLASMTAGMLARGVRGLGEAAIAERFADLGASRGGGAGDDRASVSLRTLSSPAEREASVALLARLVAEPAFPTEPLARERERATQGLREALVRPEAIAQRTFDALLYPSHPYGRQTTAESLAAIGRADLVDFHRRRYGADRAVVSMIGAITRSEAEAIAETLTRGLPAGEAPPALPQVVAPPPVERRIPHPATQSHLLVGAPAIARGDPDFFPLFVGNYVLGGGGFVSRLTAEVREKRGLSYSVYAYFSPMAQPGPFVVGLQTQKSQTEEALKVVRQTVESFVRDGPTEEELRAAKQNLVGGFALRIDSNRKILDNLATIGWYRLPLDYLERWTDQVEKVSVAQVRDAFRRAVRPESLVTVIVGAGDAKP
ncbi:MAG TPA: pitrilysin family protein [Burkholderiaceae bacterium]|nr:pitrilysin family protein [Burkholderiaceae bacterium]